MTDYLVPLILFVTTALALRRQERAYDLMLDGAAQGLKLLFTILPALIVLLTAVYMLRASGATELLSRFLSPFFSFFGIPPDFLFQIVISNPETSGISAEFHYLCQDTVPRKVRARETRTKTDIYG